MRWKVVMTRRAGKELGRLPRRIQEVFRQLVEDFGDEGPRPLGWDIVPLKGVVNMYRVRLTREYRALIEVKKPNIIVVRLAHRKESYR